VIAAVAIAALAAFAEWEEWVLVVQKRVGNKSSPR